MLDGSFFFDLTGFDAVEDVFDDIFDDPTLSDDPGSGGEYGEQGDEPMVFCGDPDADAADWVYQKADTCAVVAQLSLIEHITGADYSEAELAQVAQERGWYIPGGGTLPDDMEELLVYAGIPCRNVTDQSLLDLHDAIGRGEHVLVALDANEIWDGYEDDPENPGGHAVWVTGMSFSDDGSLCVILNDSGQPDGAAFEVSGEDFANAWADYENRAVITEINGEMRHA